MAEELKLFVWDSEDVLMDAGGGLICVLAHNLEEALKLINEKDHLVCSFHSLNFLEKEYKIISEPEAFVCWGTA